MLPTIDWKDDTIVMIDQRKLPGVEVYVTCRTAAEVAKAIKTMVIRGAPAIGVAAAMGIALGMRRSIATGTRQFTTEFQKTCEMMAATPIAGAPRMTIVLIALATSAAVRQVT
jgi:methylthioribose-1-phosphate isomerase